MGSNSADHQNQPQVPIVDFCGLDPTTTTQQPDQWAIARTQIAQAMDSYGCFQVIFDRVGPELREELFGRAVPELFGLPLETKQRNVSPYGLYMGYLGQMPNMAYESLRLEGAATVEGVEGFTRLFWPQGNPGFCDTVWTYTKHMQELAEMVHQMILQSMGLEKYYGCHMEPETSALRISEYGIPLDQKSKTGLGAHTDPNMFTIICQHKVHGLEVQTKEGEWIPVAPAPNSFTVVFGELFSAWTNGRFQPVLHRVNMTGEEKRYSALFSTRPSDHGMLQTPEELADYDHPLLFKPFNYKEYLNFRFSEEGRKCKNTLEAYCGTGSKIEA